MKAKLCIAVKEILKNEKNCFFCGCKIVTKCGFYKGAQRYKCASCKRKFIDVVRIDSAKIWQQYTQGKQTYAQLSEQYHCCKKTSQRKIDEVKIEKSTSFPAAVNLLLDTSYFGKTFGVMVLTMLLQVKYF